MLKFLDILLFTLHLIVIVFNLTGWIWKGTRRFHLWVIGLTGASWFILGIWYGWGYCFLTDWHWSIKRQLGVEDLPNSFIQYFFEAIGIGIVPNTTDSITLVAFVLAIVISIYFNFFRNP
ncbi:MAG: DUF2784 domain-containing protein [Bacteroidota bacterium]